MWFLRLELSWCAFFSCSSSNFMAKRAFHRSHNASVARVYQLIATAAKISQKRAIIHERNFYYCCFVRILLEHVSDTWNHVTYILWYIPYIPPRWNDKCITWGRFEIWAQRNSFSAKFSSLPSWDLLTDRCLNFKTLKSRYCQRVHVRNLGSREFIP